MQISASPRFLILFGLFSALSLQLLSVASLLNQPSLKAELFVQNGNLVVESVHELSSLKPGLVISRLEFESGYLNNFPDYLFIEEPDQLPTVELFKSFLSWQMQLYQFANSETPYAILNDGTALPLKFETIHLSELGLNVWILLFSGLMSLMIALSIWAFFPKRLSHVLFLFCGLTIFISATAAVIYSGRLFAVQADLLQLAMLFNHIGTLGFTLAFLALFAVYPTQIVQMVWLKVIAITYPIWLTIEQLHIWPDSLDMYLPITLIFMLSFFLAYRQWKASGKAPLERAALKWFLISFYLGTTLFIALNIVPVIMFGISPIAEQSQLFLVFLVIFIGISFGLTRYRLFELDKWWVQTWTWLISGLLILVFDLFLIYFTRMAQELSLLVAVFLAGWLYFPIRSWLTEKWSPDQISTEQLLAKLAESIFGSGTPQEMENNWKKLLIQQWQPAHYQTLNTSVDQPKLIDQGQALLIPALNSENSYHLELAAQGQRLFNMKDVDLVERLLALSRRALSALEQKNRAIHEERQRVMRDLHDDLGAQFMDLLVNAPDKHTENRVQDALRSMRAILSDLHQQPLTLQQAAHDWSELAQSRLNSHGIKSETRLAANTYTDTLLNARQVSNIRRVLNEALSNIIKHSQADRVYLEINPLDDKLSIKLTDNGQCRQGDGFSGGYGMQTMKKRIEQLGGKIRIEACQPHGCQIQLSIPIQTKNT